MAGLAGVAGLTDGSGDEAWFNQPKGVAAAEDGTLYVADTGNAILRKILGDGTVATLAITPAATVPVFTVQPGDRSVVAAASATFQVTCSGTPAPTYRWQRQAAGAGAWSDLADGGSYSGTGTATLGVGGATTAMSGDRFRCVATNSAGTATSNSAALTVSAASSGGSNSGGGGGALGLGFVVALIALASLRRRSGTRG